MSANKTSWVNGLDSIRFVLALIVLLSHLPDPYVLALKHSHNGLLHIAGLFGDHLFNGAAAVTGFFIISGFVIHYPHRHTSQLNVMSFLVRRWVRIGIPMLVVGLVGACYGKFASLPLWSLYCELVYYTLYPLLIKIKLSWQQKLCAAYALSAILIIVMFSAGRGWINMPSLNEGRNITWQAFIVFINLPCWMLGVLLAERADNFTVSVSMPYIWSMRIGSFALAMVSVVLRMHYQISFTYTLVVFALFFYKWLEAEIIYHKNNPAGQFSEYFGKFSYSLYLCHLLFITLIAHYIPLTAYTFILYILLPIILSYIAYLVVEYPSHRLARWLGKRSGG